jgi:hypothetical protein
MAMTWSHFLLVVIVVSAVGLAVSLSVDALGTHLGVIPLSGVIKVVSFVSFSLGSFVFVVWGLFLRLVLSFGRTSLSIVFVDVVFVFVEWLLSLGCASSPSSISSVEVSLARRQLDALFLRLGLLVAHLVLIERIL